MRFMCFWGLAAIFTACQPVLPNPAPLTVLPFATTEAVFVAPTPATMMSATCDRVTGEALAPYRPNEGAFVRVQGGQLVLENNLFVVRGVNYYPSNTPFQRFLTETDPEALAEELSLMRELGLNTLRIFLRHADLFSCEAGKLTANAEAFARLDSILNTLISARFRLIIALHEDVDLTDATQYSRYLAETRYLLERYRAEPAIVAWDVRDRGNLVYLNNPPLREQVLQWLLETTLAMRAVAPNQLITAGWWEDAEATAPLVDFVSFQHYGEYEPLRQTIANLRASTTKPILLTAIGYSTLTLDETTQRNLLFQSLEEVSNNRLAGWLVYMAFDYPTSVTCEMPDCPAPISEINRYGIWNTSYFPKLVVEAIERVLANTP